MDYTHRVLLFGCGSLGSNTAMHLSRRMGSDVSFVLVDYDIIEDKNRKNQPWYDVNIGQKKASVLSALLWRIAEVESIAIPRKIKTVEDIDRILKKTPCHVMVDCFDNIPSRRIIKNSKTGLDKLHSGFTETSFMCRWNKNYKLPKEKDVVNREPICDRRDLANIVQLGAALTSESLTQYLKNNKAKREYFISLDTQGSLTTYLGGK